MKLNWQIFAIGSAFFASLTAIFGKVGVSELNSNLATFIRTFFILGVSAILITARSEWVKPDQLSHKSLLFLFLSSLATGASWLCYYRALQLGPASKVAPIDKLSVVLVVILSVIFLGEELSLKSALGILSIIIGVITLAI